MNIEELDGASNKVIQEVVADLAIKGVVAVLLEVSGYSIVIVIGTVLIFVVVKACKMHLGGASRQAVAPVAPTTEVKEEVHVG